MKHRLLLIIALVVIVFSTIPTTTRTNAQPEEVLPPQIIDISPPPGAELLPEDSLTLFFDQPMDRTSVEKSVAFTPGISGNFSWDDDQTLSFKPNQDWQRGKEYQIVIGQSAKASSGQAIEFPYKFKIRTLSALAVADVVPQPDATDVTTNSKIVVSFTHPVIALGDSTTLKPFSIKPEIEGTGEWVNTSVYVFTPFNPLASGTQYQIALAAGLKSVDGSSLDNVFTWSFTTLPPQVLEVSYQSVEDYSYRGDKTIPNAQKVYPNSSFEIKFSEPVTRTNIEAAFSLSNTKGMTKPVSGKFTWNSANTQAKFAPDSLLDTDAEYKITLEATKTLKGFEFKFRTLPKPVIISTYPENGKQLVISQYSDVRVELNVPLDPKTLKDNVIVSPKVKTVSSTVAQYEDRVLLINFSKEPQTRYTITLKPGIKDKFGRSLSKQYTFSFQAITPPPTPPPPARPIVNGDMMIFPDYRGDTVVPFDVPTKQTLKFGLYRMPPTQIGDVAFSNHQIYMRENSYTSGSWNSTDGRRCKPPTAVNKSNVIRTWSQTLDPKDGKQQNVLVASKAGGKLPLGLYWLTVGDETECIANYYADFPSDFVTEKGPEYQFGFAVVTANITLKRSPIDAFIFLTDLQTAKPIANAKVTIYGDGKVLTTATTDSTGAAQLPVLLSEHRFILITAEASGVFGAWYNVWRDGGWRTFEGGAYDYGYDLYEPQHSAGYIYTDRPIYRPGDTVRFRGVLRDKHDLQYPVSSNRTAYLKIGTGIYSSYMYLDDDHKWLQEAKLTLTDFGTFSGEYKIPLDAPLGELGIWVSLEDRKRDPNSYYVYMDVSDDAIVNFTIAAYRAPEFEIDVTTDQSFIYQGDAVEATARARYYFGGPVADTRIAWNIYYAPTYFRYTGTGHYSFTNNDWNFYYDYYYYDYYYNQGGQFDEGFSRTGADGRARIVSEKTKDDGNRPVKITIEGSIRDESGQTVSGSTSVIAHPSDFYVGIGSSSAIVDAKKAVNINLITVTPDSKPKPGQSVELALFRYDWTTHNGDNWREVSDAIRGEAKTGDDGTTSFAFTPPESGYYRIRAQATDSKGRKIAASITLWVTQAGKASWYVQSGEGSLNLLTNQREYNVGDVAEILIPVPYPERTTILLAVERAGVITHDVVYSNGDPLLYKLPITDGYAPNAYITATYIRGIDAKNRRPTFRVSNSVEIRVGTLKRQLNVQLKASQGQLKPGETVTFEVNVTDGNGKPVVAEVGLKLVDKAVLDLMPDNAGTLADAFFHRQGQEMYTDLSIDGLLDEVDTKLGGPPGRGGGGGGGGGGTGVAIRQNYETTPLWSPHVVTNNQGYASVSITLPDNLTTFQLDARALTADKNLEVGEAALDIVTSLPLIVRPVTPRFFVAGDEVELAAIIHNNTDDDQTVQVGIQETGIQLKTSEKQTVSVIAGGRLRVAWNGLVENVENVDLTFTATGKNGLQDAAKPALATGPNNTIPVYQYQASEPIAVTGGVLRNNGSKTEAVTLPPRLNIGQGELLIQLDSSLSSTLVNSFTFLRQYPHYCIEQTVSRFLPNVVTHKALEQLYQQNPMLKAQLESQIKAATQKLEKEQKSDGSWGWYPSMPTDPLTSAYATLGLIELQKAGFQSSKQMLEKAISFVQTQLSAPVSLNDWQLNRQAFYLYVLARTGKGDLKNYDELQAVQTRLSLAARAYLLMAFHERYPQHAAIKTLISDVLSAATFSSTGVHWEEEEVDWYNWGSNTRTTAILLTALLRVAPQSELIPNIVRWLMSARKADYWPTTQETVWAITGLTEWLVITDELRGDYRYDIKFNGDSLASSTAQSILDNGQTLHVQVKDLLQGKVNRLAISRSEGTGALYYTTKFNMELPADSVKATSRGISIKREYFLNENTETPITSAHVGDLITVRLTVTTAENLQYFALEDMFPAGTEAVDTTLLTTSIAAQGQSIRTVSRNNPYWYWGSWYFNHTELRDAQTNLYASYLPQGTYIYTYQLQATTPGKFQVIPTYAYTFYYSEIFGRSEGIRFVILPEEEKPIK